MIARLIKTPLRVVAWLEIPRQTAILSLLPWLTERIIMATTSWIPAARSAIISGMISMEMVFRMN